VSGAPPGRALADGQMGRSSAMRSANRGPAPVRPRHSRRPTSLSCPVLGSGLAAGGCVQVHVKCDPLLQFRASDADRHCRLNHVTESPRSEEGSGGLLGLGRGQWAVGRGQWPSRSVYQVSGVAPSPGVDRLLPAFLSSDHPVHCFPARPIAPSHLTRGGRSRGSAQAKTGRTNCGDCPKQQPAH
jgi:hypothetical protein